MAFLKIVLILIDVLSCFLLVGIILIQRSKNEGMGGLAMGAGMGEALFGSRTGNVLTRATIILACVFMGTTTLLAVVYSRTGREASVIEQKLQSMPVAPAPQNAPMSAPPIGVPAAAPAPVAPVPVEVTPQSPVAAPAPIAIPAVPAAPVSAPAAPAAP